MSSVKDTVCTSETLSAFSSAVTNTNWNEYKKGIRSAFKQTLGKDPHHGSREKGDGIYRSCSQYFAQNFGMKKYLPCDCPKYCVGTCSHDSRTSECVPEHGNNNNNKGYRYLCSFNLGHQMCIERNIPLPGSPINDYPTLKSSTSFVFNVNGTQALEANVKIITRDSLFSEKVPSGHKSTASSAPFAQSRISFGKELKLSPLHVPSGNFNRDLLIKVERDNSKKYALDFDFETVPFVNGVGIWYQLGQKPKLMLQFLNAHLFHTKISFYERIDSGEGKRIENISVNYRVQKNKRNESLDKWVFRWQLPLLSTAPPTLAPTPLPLPFPLNIGANYNNNIMPIIVDSVEQYRAGSNPMECQVQQQPPPPYTLNNDHHQQLAVANSTFSDYPVFDYGTSHCSSSSCSSGRYTPYQPPPQLPLPTFLPLFMQYNCSTSEESSYYNFHQLQNGTPALGERELPHTCVSPVSVEYPLVSNEVRAFINICSTFNCFERVLFQYYLTFGIVEIYLDYISCFTMRLKKNDGKKQQKIARFFFYDYYSIY